MTKMLDGDELILSYIRAIGHRRDVIAMLAHRTDSWVARRLTAMRKDGRVKYSTLSQRWYATKKGGRR